MIRRRGITLVEVLAAIFIMGIGLLALLTLFPLGAISMANSVRDNNAAMAGSVALGTAQSFDLRNDSNVIAGLQTPPSVVDPIFGIPMNGFVVQGFNIQQNGPGYPIFVDPTYANFLNNPPSFYANNIGYISPTSAGTPPVTPGIRRISPFFNNYQFIASNLKLPSLRDRFFTYLDDVTFDANGMPRDPSGSPASPAFVAQQIDRPGSLSWAYMLRPGRRGASQLNMLPPSASPLNGNNLFEPPAEMSVVIYRARPVNSPIGETPYIAVGAIGTTTLNLTYTTPPDIRVGEFILDTTYDIALDPINPNGNFVGSVHGYFYKVVDILDQPKLTPPTMTLTLATPLRMNVLSAAPPSFGQPTTGQIVHMKYVIDVQERGLGGKP